MRESWTDERLDDFRGEVNRRFDEVDRRFEEVNQRFDSIDRRLERVDERFDQLNQTILRLGGGALITFVVGFTGVIVTQL